MEIVLFQKSWESANPLEVLCQKFAYDDAQVLLLQIEFDGSTARASACWKYLGGQAADSWNHHAQILVQHVEHEDPDKKPIFVLIIREAVSQSSDTRHHLTHDIIIHQLLIITSHMTVLAEHASNPSLSPSSSSSCLPAARYEKTCTDTHLYAHTHNSSLPHTQTSSQTD